MIYSASRRTDLVAFYPDWIAEKVRRSRKLDALVVWTKDPRNLIHHPALFLTIQAVPTVVQLTITGLAGGIWEPDVPAPELFTDTLRTLAEVLPHGAVQWRFDPILADGTVFDRFDAAKALLDETGIRPDGVTVSFPDAYPKVIKRLAKDGMLLPVLSFDQRLELLRGLHEHSGLTLRLCCENELLLAARGVGDGHGIEQGHCIDGALIDRLYGTSLATLPRDRSQREHCGCTQSTEIGSYEQHCHHNCRYCYARPERD